MRVGSFQHTIRAAAPVGATIRFGPEGVEGRVTAGPFGPIEDALLSTPGQNPMAVHLASDGSFRAGSGDELQGGQLLDEGLLTDRQRARQSLYKKLLAEPQPRYLANRNLLLAWAEPVDMHFSLAPQARRTGSALLAIPVRFERTPPGLPVRIPAPFVECRRITDDGRAISPKQEAREGTNMRLRFQVPHSALPMIPETARLTVRMNAPLREVVVGAYDGRDAVVLRRLASPLGTVQMDLEDPRFLRLDDQGALYVNLVIGAAQGPQVEQNLWRVESVGLEVRGRTTEEGRDAHAAR
jgi:hypothetical protein